MSLGSLARYDDAEDEIKDEDHDLVLAPPRKSSSPGVSTVDILGEEEPMQVEAKPSPSTNASKPKQLVLVDYGDMSDDDDDMSESDPDDDDEESKIEVVNPTASKSASVVNLGLYDVSTVLSGEPESSVPGRLNDSFTEERLSKPIDLRETHHVLRHRGTRNELPTKTLRPVHMGTRLLLRRTRKETEGIS